MSSLDRVLRKPMLDVPRTRRYQEIMDQHVDKERKRLTPEFFATTAWGRALTAPLCNAAFCWYSPLSRHHGDSALLHVFTEGLRQAVRRIEHECDAAGSESVWSFGWDIEGLVYGMVFCRDALEPGLTTRARDAMLRLGLRSAAAEKVPQLIGSYGNQRACYALGLHLAGTFCSDQALFEQGERQWADALPYILDASGQVIEQYGPCMHYSYTAFIYAWLNLVVRGQAVAHETTIVRALEWFRARHTESLYPLAGPSMRCYYETMPATVIDLLPAAEQVAHRDPSLREFVYRAAHRHRCTTGPIPATKAAAELDMQDSVHGTSMLMWAMLAAGDNAPIPRPPPAPTGFACFYEHTHVCKRTPLKYLLLRGAGYQTHANATDYLPFAGIQTWALADEPPIIHPTPLAPSTTQAYTLDTARQGASHNWGLYGAGALGIDAYACNPTGDPNMILLLMRHDWFWKVLIFTDSATVQLEFGNGGARHTFWTLNRVEPAVPTITPGLVRFAGHRACLHSTVATAPELRELAIDDDWATGVRQLVYACGAGPAAFAFADAAFGFAGRPLDDGRTLRFHDAGGAVTATLPEAFLGPNPGQFRHDVHQLVRDIVIRRA